MTVLLLPTRGPTYRTPLMHFLKHINFWASPSTWQRQKFFSNQPNHYQRQSSPNIDIEGTMQDNVDHFPYLSNSANIDVEIQHRIRCACFSYSMLKDRVFSERGFRTATKILVYKAVILTTLLYGCETWVAYRRHVKVLKQFQQRILRSILGVHWQDRITNASILEQADTTSIRHILSSHS